MKKIRILRVAAAVLTAALLVIIYVMSAAPAVRSEGMSRPVGRRIAGLIVPDLEKMDAAKQDALIARTDRFVRKTAHFAEFFILGALLALNCLLWGMKGWVLAVVPAVCGVAAAALDEAHQLFVPGRAGSFRDVLIDSAGVIAGCAVVLCVAAVRAVRTAKRKKAPETDSGD